MEKRISGHTGLLALIGSPVEHSASPLMYNYSFERLPQRRSLRRSPQRNQRRSQRRSPPSPIPRIPRILTAVLLCRQKSPANSLWIWKTAWMSMATPCTSPATSPTPVECWRKTACSTAPAAPPALCSAPLIPTPTPLRRKKPAPTASASLAPVTGTALWTL